MKKAIQKECRSPDEKKAGENASAGPAPSIDNARPYPPRYPPEKSGPEDFSGARTETLLSTTVPAAFQSKAVPFLSTWSFQSIYYANSSK